MKKTLNKTKRIVAFVLAVLMLASAAYGCWENHIPVRAESEKEQQTVPADAAIEHTEDTKKIEDTEKTEDTEVTEVPVQTEEELSATPLEKDTVCGTVPEPKQEEPQQEEPKQEDAAQAAPAETQQMEPVAGIAAASTNVCKIGNTMYTSLKAAIEAASAAGTPATIEMLVSRYEIPESIEMGIQSDITITTSASVGTPCVLVRSATFKETYTSTMLSTNGSGNKNITIKFKNITIDAKMMGKGTAPETFHMMTGTLALGEGATIQNADAGDIVTTSLSGHFVMEDGSVIQNCNCASIMCASTFGTLDMSGGVITNCVVTSAVIFTANRLGSVAMSGGTIQGNYVVSNDSTSAVVRLSQDIDTEFTGGEISGNYLTSGAGLTVTGGCKTLKVGGDAVIQNNYSGCTVDAANHKVSAKGAVRNVVMENGKMLTVSKPFSEKARIGVTFADAANMKENAEIGRTEAADASSVAGLEHIVADTNTGDKNTDLAAKAGEGNKVVWGKTEMEIGYLLSRNGKEIEYNDGNAASWPRAGETVTVRATRTLSPSATNTAYDVMFHVPKLQIGGSNVEAKKDSLTAYIENAGKKQTITIGNKDIFNKNNTTKLSIPAKVSGKLCVEYQVEIPTILSDKATLENECAFNKSGTEMKVAQTANLALCKIGENGYGGLTDAIAAVTAGNPAKIEMLVESHEISETQNVPTGTDVTITTAKELSKPCVLKRGIACKGTMIKSEGNLILNRITLDGMRANGSMVSDNNKEGLLYVAAGTMELGDQATVQNCTAPQSYCAGVWVSGAASKVEMKEGSLIQNCHAGYGGALLCMNGSEAIMSGGTIQGCAARNANLNIISAVAVENSTFRMTGGSIKHNYNFSTVNAGVVCVGKTGTGIFTGGEICENYAVSAGGAGVRNIDATGKLEIGDDMVIQDNYGACTINPTTFEVTKKGKLSNVALTSGIKLQISSSLGTKADIGLTMDAGGGMAAGAKIGTTTSAAAADVENLDHITADTNGNPNTINLKAEAGSGNDVVWGVKATTDISYLATRGGKETECGEGYTDTCIRSGETVTVRTKLASLANNTASYQAAFRVSKLQIAGMPVEIKDKSLKAYTEENGTKHQMALDHTDIFKGTTTATLTMPEKAGAVYVEYQVEIPYGLSEGNQLENECVIRVGKSEIKVSKVVNAAVCQIGEKGYETLKDALTAVTAGTPAKIEMLVEKHEILEMQNVLTGTDVTITTAQAVKNPCVLKRGTACEGTMIQSVGDLHLNRITLDGMRPNGSMTSANATGLLYVTAGTLELGDQATIQNSDTPTKYCAGVWVKGATAKVEMKEGSLIENCYGTCGGAVLCQAGSTFTMSGGTIQHCAGRNYNANFTCAVDTENSTFKMTGGSIKHNYSFSTSTNAPVVCVEKSGTGIFTGGEICENYAVSKGGAGVRNHSKDGKLEIGENMVIQDNYGDCTIDPTTFDVTKKGKLSNLALSNGIKLQISSSLGSRADIGLTVEAGGGMAAGAVIGTTAAEANTDNLDHITADTNTGNQLTDLLGCAGTGNEVIWGINAPLNFSFTKVDAADNTKTLSGVEFKLYQLNEAKRDEVIKNRDAVVSEETIADGTWTLVKNTVTDSATHVETELESFVSDENGLVQMNRLTNDYYMLVETKCADGYQLPKGQWLLNVHNKEAEVISITSHGQVLTPAFYTERDRTTNEVVYYLPNTKTFILPFSGFGGITIYLIIGGSIMAAALLLMRYKRKKDRGMNG